jgi:hypothetical protein
MAEVMQSEVDVEGKVFQIIADKDSIQHISINGQVLSSVKSSFLGRGKHEFEFEGDKYQFNVVVEIGIQVKVKKNGQNKKNSGNSAFNNPYGYFAVGAVLVVLAIKSYIKSRFESSYLIIFIPVIIVGAILLIIGFMLWNKKKD